MTEGGTQPQARGGQATRRRLGVLGVMLGLGALLAATFAGAAEAPVGLGTADAFAVLAGATVTNTGPSVVNGNLGACPGPDITGFPPGVVNGTTHANDAVACQAQANLTTAYTDAAGRAPSTTFPGPEDLGGMTLVAGVYTSPTSLAITGTLTLDAQGDPSAVFIFKAGSTLTTATNSNVALINGAQACNVFWQVGSSATLGVGSTFVGTILALTSITANSSADVQGRLLARNGAVTLDSTTVTRPRCATTTSTLPTTTSSSTTTSTLPTTTSSSTTTSTLPTTTSSSTTTSTLPTNTTTSSTTSSTLPTTTSSRPVITIPLPGITITLPVITVPLPGATISTASTTAAAPTTTTTAAPTTTTAPSDITATPGSGAATTSTTAGVGEAAASGADSAQRVASGRTLPRTGSTVAWPALVGGIAVDLGLIALLVGHEPLLLRRRRLDSP